MSEEMREETSAPQQYDSEMEELLNRMEETSVPEVEDTEDLYLKAVEERDVEHLKQLYDSGYTPPMRPAEELMTPLYLAIESNQSEMAR